MPENRTTVRRSRHSRRARALALVAAPILVPASMLLSACAGGPGAGSPAASSAAAIDSARLLSDHERLAHDSTRGRLAGTPEIAEVRDFLATRFDAAGLARVGDARLQHFTFIRRDSTRVPGANVMGLVRGTAHPGRYIVVSAHFDHVGVRAPVDGDSIYNGADDNASGTAALLALAEHFARHPARHSLLFVAFDAEEQGLRGARAFVAALPVPRDSIVLNVNMDMVSLSARGELYAAGAAKHPRLRAPLERVAARAPVTLLLGHDVPQPTPRDDWTMQSDQGAFHEAGIPFVYFGVEDHPHYHRPSDEVRNTTPGFYVRAVRTVLEAIRELDAP